LRCDLVMAVAVDEHKIVLLVILMIAIHMVDFHDVFLTKMEFAVAAFTMLLLEQSGSAWGVRRGLRPRLVPQYTQSPSKGDRLPRTLMCRTIFVASCRSNVFPALVVKTHFLLPTTLEYFRIFFLRLLPRLLLFTHALRGCPKTNV
jgi:hypothetical protein